MITNVIVFIFFGVGFISILYYILKALQVLWRVLHILWKERKYIPHLSSYLVSKWIYPSGASCEICRNFIKNKDNTGNCVNENSLLYKSNNICLKWNPLIVAEEDAEAKRILNKSW